MRPDKNKHSGNSEAPQVIRVKLPKGKEVIGIIESRLGGNRMSVDCLDKVNRKCRIPGRLKRRLWIRPGDVVIVEPWEFDNEKGDILFKYTPPQVDWLKKKGHLKEDKTEF